MTDSEIIAIRDAHLPSQGEPFDCLAFARAVLDYAQAWRPMESAPKDGTRVMLVWNDFGPTMGCWNTDKYAAKPRPYWSHDRERLLGTRSTRASAPTGWLPLPPLPGSGK